ncbi:tocopherol cyclase family protein [Lyngbya confervoides]|uniref:Tocopherol cyclase family protein n=1 Tax=Lyngbya confervoides BDU141951 TaxID=1574623 RepID=A0ABD4T8W5_9CYAN|nr:tocopherol cyclase family protein [Lyngbya confervoides]MCM1985071.1 tocopherol cyclase family protein [Lyngbya confervoides BDU141951]
MLLQTPHSGFHWDGRQQPFFEGWYYRLTLPPDCPFRQTSGPQTLAFMYSLQAPRSLTGARSQPGGGSVQILGPEEQYFCRSLPDLSKFWAWKTKLGHGQSRTGKAPMPEGYWVSAHLHKGQFWDPAQARMLRWRYHIEPVYGWGSPQARQQSTAGWLSRLQMFEPGWQILMAHGWATGWFELQDLSGDGQTTHRFEFQRVPAYAEKNWGGAFPKKWFWIQCNAFDQEPDLALTCGGGIRRVLGWQESVGMVGVHYRGRFYEFVPWNGKVCWRVAPWGSWQIWAEQPDYAIALRGHCADPGVLIRVPTASGLDFLCRDTTRGLLSVKLWEKQGGAKGLIMQAHSQQAGLEIGGLDWTADWDHDP